MTLSNTNILITGGAGFIGSHLAKKLLLQNARLTIVDNLSTSSIDNIKPILNKIDFTRSDLDKYLTEASTRLDSFQAIFHLAANSYVPPSVENPMFDYHQNLYSTFLLLEMLRKTKNPPHLFNASSAAVYGSPDTLPIKETDPVAPIAPYGVSKLAAECYATVYGKIYGIKATNFRFFSVYGPRLHKQIIFDLLVKIKNNPNEIEVIGDGTQVRDFIYIDDLINAILAVAEKADGNGESLNIATGDSYSISDIVKLVCESCKVNPKIKYTDKLRFGDSEKWIVDISRLKKFGFSPKTPITEGVDNVTKWFYSQSVK